MSKITGTIYIDFETSVDITEEQFSKFKKELDKLIDGLDENIYSACEDSGFESESYSNASLVDIEIEKPEDDIIKQDSDRDSWLDDLENDFIMEL